MLGIVTRLRPGRYEVRFLKQAKYVSSLEMFAFALGTTQRLAELVEGLLRGGGWGKAAGA